MSASYVQKAQAQGSGVASITTVGMTTTTGNTVVVSIGCGPDFISLTDNGTSNTVTAVAAPTLNPGGGELDLIVKCLMNINGKVGHTFTANFTNDFCSMTAIELAGVTASSLDTGSVASGSDLTSPYTVTSNTFAQADEIVLLFNGPYAGGTSTFSESTGFTSIGGQNDNNNYCGNWNWYKNVLSTSALTPSLTDSTGTSYAGMLMVIAGFKSSASGGNAVNPGAGSLTLSGFAPTIAQPHGTFPGVASLTLTGFAPTVAQPHTASPGASALTFTGFAPAVSQSVNQQAFPGAGALSLSGFAPAISQPQTAAPGVGSLALTGFAPTVGLGQNVQPGAGALTLSGFAPTVAQSANQAVSPGAGTLALSGFSPSTTQSNNLAANPGVGALTLSGFAPTVSQQSQSPNVLPGAGSLVLTGYAPTVSTSGGFPGFDVDQKRRRLRETTVKPMLVRAMERRLQNVKPAKERAAARAKAIEFEAASMVLDGATQREIAPLLQQWEAQRPYIPPKLADVPTLDVFLSQIRFRIEQAQAQKAALEAIATARRQDEDALFALLLA
jgi:hypothetical protein